MPSAECVKCRPSVVVKAKTLEELRALQREHDRKYHKRGFDLFGADVHAAGYSLYANKNRGFY